MPAATCSGDSATRLLPLTTPTPKSLSAGMVEMASMSLWWKPWLLISYWIWSQLMSHSHGNSLAPRNSVTPGWPSCWP